MLDDRLLLHWPRLLVFHHGIENCQELTHAGRQRDLLGFARGPPALIKPFEHWVVPDRDQRPHGSGGPDMGATAPGRPYAPHGPAVSMKWSHPDQSREALAAQGA
jgi:hypothetical protein